MWITLLIAFTAIFEMFAKLSQILVFIFCSYFVQKKFIMLILLILWITCGYVLRIQYLSILNNVDNFVT